MAVEKEPKVQSLGEAEQQHTPDNAEILRKTWSRKAVTIAFSGVFAATFILNFNKFSSGTYVPFATSNFQRHSALSTANVVGAIISMVAFPILAKFSNVFGRAEGLTVAVLCLTLNDIMIASSQNIGMFIAGTLFSAIGENGYNIMVQIFIADTVNLVNRGLWSNLPEAIATIPTLYLGTLVAEKMLEHSTWRWGYGMWAIILPVSAIPLIGTLYILQRRARKAGYRREGAWDTIDKSVPLHQRLFRLFYIDLDIVGAFLLVAGLALLLVPLSLTGTRRSDRWSDGGNITMLVLGIVLLGVFLIWDTKFAKSPFVPFRMVRERTVVAACGLAILHWMHYAIFTPFFPSYLQVAGGFSPGHATRIDNALRVAVQVAAIFVGLFMKYTKRTQPSVFFGVPITILGQGLLIYFVSQDGGASNSNEASFVVAKVLIGIGLAFQGTGAQIAIQALVPHEDMPVATAVYFASMNLGGAIGACVSGSIWNEHLPKKLMRYLPNEVKPQTMAIFQSFVFAQRFPKGSTVRAAIDKSYRETQQLLAITATSILAPMLIVMFFMKNVNLEKADEMRMANDKSHQGVIDRSVGTRKSVNQDTVQAEKQL
ncbi:hypothetical protein FOVG_15098 [Fusarium oxysporum f. sp. pisi HDV247]|uniref:Major facilitator superfamily (MFS) profile domain-containing protein n=1 Tax=Fusarium oxysporum f. sp. pisi HDV247 TaxID=1080344 RepID=W9NM15_FUSOX|nr:hypothetical protein FOVG_15098 [Fusarium oxysporum f. sp. pisi HDV247]